MRYMEWEQYRLELIRRGHDEGFEQGEKRGIGRTLKRAVRTQFRSLTEAGIDKERALQSVCKDYPDFSDQAIRKILNA